METKQQTGVALTRRECVTLLEQLAPAQLVSVYVTGAPPVTVACFLSAASEAVIPTGADRGLVRAAAGQVVTIEFERSDHDTGQRWVVRGTGHARPLAHHRRPPDAVDTGTALTMLYAFENGIQVRLEELSGQRTTLTNGTRVLT